MNHLDYKHYTKSYIVEHKERILKNRMVVKSHTPPGQMKKFPGKKSGVEYAPWRRKKSRK
jgi:hypothetical protein